MAISIEVRRSQAYLLWAMLLLYMLARFCQLYADRLPSLLIVILHVVPPAVFAFVHGSILYRVKGMSMFAVFCLGFGAVAESISLRTGFPFGHYYFTEVMGPKILQSAFLFGCLWRIAIWPVTRSPERGQARMVFHVTCYKAGLGCHSF
jgi:putative membrane protein